jgi:hypothetical protein
MTKSIQKNLSAELARMVRTDQEMRKKYEKTGVWDGQIDIRNTKRLKNIVSKHGWPTIDMVGKTCSRNAWLLIQHADRDVKFQSAILRRMKEILQKSPKSIDPSNVAYLTDRVLVNLGKSQSFGTQFYFTKSGDLKPRSIKDLKTLDTRRKLYGLKPFYKDLIAAKHYRKPLINGKQRK